MPVSIRIAGNTARPTLLAIQAKGYKVTSFYTQTGKKLFGTEVNELEATYKAEKEGCRFSDNDLEELLGLIAMWEMRGNNWQYNSEIEPDIQPELIDSTTIYDEEGNIIKG